MILEGEGSWHAELSRTSSVYLNPTEILFNQLISGRSAPASPMSCITKYTQD